MCAQSACAESLLRAAANTAGPITETSKVVSNQSCAWSSVLLCVPCLGSRRGEGDVLIKEVRRRCAGLGQLAARRPAAPVARPVKDGPSARLRSSGAVLCPCLGMIAPRFAKEEMCGLRWLRTSSWVATSGSYGYPDLVCKLLQQPPSWLLPPSWFPGLSQHARLFA